MVSSGAWRGRKGAKPTHLAWFDELLHAIRKCSIFSPVWQELFVSVIPMVNKIVMGVTNSPRFWE
jgi:hypothetical protein